MSEASLGRHSAASEQTQTSMQRVVHFWVVRQSPLATVGGSGRPRGESGLGTGKPRRESTLGCDSVRVAADEQGVRLRHL